MLHNIPPSPFSVEYDNQYPRQPTWEDFLQCNHDRTFVYETPFIQDGGFTTLEGPAPVSEIMFEKPIEAPQPMEMEEEFISYANENTFSPDYEFFSTIGEGDDFPEFTPENYDELIARQAQQEAYNGYENSECSRCHSDEEEEEEVGSISTMDSRFADSFLDEANSYTNWENNSIADQTFDADNEINQKVMNFVLQRPDEEKEYIKRVMPMLLSSIRQIQAQAPIPLDDNLIGALLKELIYKKELMIGEERNFLRGMIDDEMSAFRASRPTAGIAEEDLMVKKRKDKRAAKGNRNTSAVNHFNENCVSNIFQFSKGNYPEDKDVQRIGNERNVSATSFKKMMKPTLNDDLFSRKAKARITANGQELIGNIENWMNAGYFEQCADREKYILQKEKAIRDLGLSGQY
jgi:hypothetical protein